MYLLRTIVKLPNLKLNTQPKKLLGSLVNLCDDDLALDAFMFYSIGSLGIKD